MVEQITAFKADDGSIHPTKLKAVEADAMSALKQLELFNHGSALACIKDAVALVHILGPVAAAQAEAQAEAPATPNCLPTPQRVRPSDGRDD